MNQPIHRATRRRTNTSVSHPQKRGPKGPSAASISRVGHDAVLLARNQLAHVGDSIAHAGEQVTESVRKGRQQVSRSIRAKQRAITRAIEDQPIRSTLLGVGIGFALGLIPLLWMRIRRPAPTLAQSLFHRS